MFEQSSIEDGKLYISCLIDAKPDRVYQAWADPAQIGLWMGPGSVVCEEANIDLRVGGKYRLAMRTDDGLKVAYGVYREIEPQRKLVFTWQWEDGTFNDSLVTLKFSSIDGKTRLELTHTELPDETFAEHHSQGWTGSLVKLEQHLSA